jgi:hypothetical protein
MPYAVEVGVELDHVFCFVDPEDSWRERARIAGWVLDEEIDGAGPGTRRQRLWFGDRHLELVWLSSRADAEAHPLGLHRRADWRTTGACPFGIGVRGTLPDDARSEFWSYQPPSAPDQAIWIHRSNEVAPEQPLLLALHPAPGRAPPPSRHARAGRIEAVRLELPVPVQPLVAHVAPAITCRTRPRPRLEVVVGSLVSGIVPLTDVLALRG